MSRRHDLDWVRVCAFGLLVLYHVGMYYVTWDWHVKSPFAGTGPEPFMLLTAPWRLALLFLVSGAATSFLLGKSETGFLRQRSWRLLVPLLFGMLVVVPPQAYYEVVEKLPGGYFDGYLAFWGRYLAADPGFCRDGECLDLPTWNHLWFVAYLWVYTVVLAVALRFAPNGMARLGEHVTTRLGGIGLLLWPALGLMLARIVLVGRFESTHALVDDWYNHAQYLPVFLLGYWLARADGVWLQMQRLRWPALGLALASWGFLAWYFGHFDETNPPGDALRTIQRAVWGLNQWSSITAVLGFAHRLAPGDSPALRYLSAAVFPVYILHQTVIVVFAHRLQPFGMAPALEAPLLILATFAVCFGGYELIRRVAWLRPLFGLKAMPRRAVAGQPATVES